MNVKISGRSNLQHKLIHIRVYLVDSKILHSDIHTQYCSFSRYQSRLYSSTEIIVWNHLTRLRYWPDPTRNTLTRSDHWSSTHWSSVPSLAIYIDLHPVYNRTPTVTGPLGLHPPYMLDNLSIMFSSHELVSWKSVIVYPGLDYDSINLLLFVSHVTGAHSIIVQCHCT